MTVGARSADRGHVASVRGYDPNTRLPPHSSGVRSAYLYAPADGFSAALAALAGGMRRRARGGLRMALSEFPRLGFDPFVELRRMQSEMNRLFSGFTPAARDFPPINIWLGDTSVVVTGELPGVTRDDVTISLEEDVLTLEGARRPRQEQDANWQRRE